MSLKKHSQIQKKIDKYKLTKPNAKFANNSNQAFNIAVELVSGVIVGVIIGLFFDKLFDSKPIFLIICIILGIMASFKLIWNKYIESK